MPNTQSTKRWTRRAGIGEGDFESVSAIPTGSWAQESTASSRYHCVLPNQQKMRFLVRTTDPNAVLIASVSYYEKNTNLRCNQGHLVR